MNKLILPLLFLAAAIAATSCAKKTAAAEPRRANIYFPEMLFEYEGCRVYRFQDGLIYHYFTNCNGGMIE